MNYDKEFLAPTEEYIQALKNLMKAELNMMKRNFPEDSDCWDWGICTINDLAKRDGLSFEFGGDEDRPFELPENTDVLVRLNY